MWDLVWAIWDTFFPIKEVKWEDYMGDWKEPCDMPKGNDLTLYDSANLKNVARGQPIDIESCGTIAYKKDGGTFSYSTCTNSISCGGIGINDKKKT
jgi:hypothetical protein